MTELTNKEIMERYEQNNIKLDILKSKIYRALKNTDFLQECCLMDLSYFKDDKTWPELYEEIKGVPPKRTYLSITSKLNDD